MRILVAIDRVFSFILGLIVAGMMVMTFIDVVLREVFLAPLIIAPELTTIGLAAMVFVGLPIVSLRDEHITISLFEKLFRGPVQRIKKALIAVLLAFLSGVLCVQLWAHAVKMGPEVMMFLEVRKTYIAYVMSVLSGLTALVFLIRAVLCFADTPPEFGDQPEIGSGAGS